MSATPTPIPHKHPAYLRVSAPRRAYVMGGKKGSHAPFAAVAPVELPSLLRRATKRAGQNARPFTFFSVSCGRLLHVIDLDETVAGRVAFAADDDSVVTRRHALEKR